MATGTGRGDTALWQAAADGDHDAFGQLFERHATAVYNYLFRRTADWSMADDLRYLAALSRAGGQADVQASWAEPAEQVAAPPRRCSASRPVARCHRHAPTAAARGDRVVRVLRARSASRRDRSRHLCRHGQVSPHCGSAASLLARRPDGHSHGRYAGGGLDHRHPPVSAHRASDHESGYRRNADGSGLVPAGQPQLPGLPAAQGADRGTGDGSYRSRQHSPGRPVRSTIRLPSSASYDVAASTQLGRADINVP